MDMPVSPLVKTLSRRRFLKAAGVFAGCMTMAPLASALGVTSQTVELALGTKKYRGTTDGRILLSVDGGLSWKQIVNFGPEISVEALVANDQGMVKAQLVGNHSPFWVQSTNDKIWLTENFRAPAQA